MRYLLIFSIALSFMLFSCETENDDKTQVEYLTSDATKALNLPFSEAVRVGDFLFLSGQIGNKPGTLELVEGGIVQETKQVLENIKRILEQNGSSLDQVVKCTLMLADIAEWGELNKIYKTYFNENLPARSALGMVH
ncbi:MAG: RidA family protein [Bacteroidetes bacterium]|nr:RidA family protein [Bacteroidota bacterium]